MENKGCWKKISDWPSSEQMVHMASRESKDLRLAFGFAKHIFAKIEGYKIVDGTMILFWHEKAVGITRFPYPMDVEQVSSFVEGWLSHTRPNYPKPDVDGTIVQGWEFYARGWGVVDNESYAHIIVRPVWFVYGK